MLLVAQVGRAGCLATFLFHQGKILTVKSTWLVSCTIPDQHRQRYTSLLLSTPPPQPVRFGLIYFLSAPHLSLLPTKLALFNLPGWNLKSLSPTLLNSSMRQDESRTREIAERSNHSLVQLHAQLGEGNAWSWRQCMFYTLQFDSLIK